MASLKKAGKHFLFYTETSLPELTGLKAANLQQLVSIIKTVPKSSIYYHTHHSIRQHHFLSLEPPNDFAYWITNILGEEELGEGLFSIDTVQYTTIHDLRDEIVQTIENYITKYPRALKRFATPGEEFHFIKSVSFVMQTPYAASNLAEFMHALQCVSLDSIYFHMFESRLRVGQVTNDFSFWLEDSLSENVLANKIASLDPYTCTLENLRFTLIKLINKRIEEYLEHEANLPRVIEETEKYHKD